MLPLYLLTSAKGQPILVELKNGETLNGNLVICDSWMNLTLNNVIQSSANGESFLKLPEVYVRGNHIKYLRLPDEVLDSARQQAIENHKHNNRRDNRGGNRRDNRSNNRYGNRNYNNNNSRNNYNNNNNRGYRNYNNNNSNGLNQQQQPAASQHDQQSATVQY